MSATAPARRDGAHCGHGVAQRNRREKLSDVAFGRITPSVICCTRVGAVRHRVGGKVMAKKVKISPSTASYEQKRGAEIAHKAAQEGKGRTKLRLSESSTQFGGYEKRKNEIRQAEMTRVL